MILLIILIIILFILWTFIKIAAISDNKIDKIKKNDK